MSTSDLLTRMYAMPSELLKQQEQSFMQKPHITLGSQPSGTTAPSVRSFSASAQISRSYSDPYLQRVYWLLTNSQGFYLAGVCGTSLQWVTSANAVPEPLRFLTHQRVKSMWLRLRELTPVQDEGLAISPVNFYAHCLTPQHWCALDD